MQGRSKGCYFFLDVSSVVVFCVLGQDLEAMFRDIDILCMTCRVCYGYTLFLFLLISRRGRHSCCLYIQKR